MYNPYVYTSSGYPQYYYPGYQMQQSTPQGQGAASPPQIPAGSQSMTPLATPGAPGAAGSQAMLPTEQSYIENILRLNRGKTATVHMTFEGGEKKVFTGVVEAAGRDHIIISDPQTGRRYVLLMVYLDYVTFDEPIEYSYPLNQVATYPPR